jgi:putative sigma-54 modulation protein
VGLAQAKDMMIAVGQALDHLEKQAVKYKTRWQSKKRSARKSEEEKKWNGASVAQPAPATKVGLTEKTAVPVAVHRFPPVAKITDVHLVRSPESVAMRPMTLEEAIKEAHFRDRDVFVFRDPKGKLMILHRTRDGKMELIEAP